MKYRTTFLPVTIFSETKIEEICHSLGLNLTLKTTLKSLPANTHWHFKQGNKKGVLEITQIKSSGELIFEVHENRNGGWEADLISKILLEN